MGADLPPGELSRRIADASRRLDRAEDSLAGLAPRAVAAIPLVGRSWVAERRAVEAGQLSLEGAGIVATALPGLRRDDGRVDVAALARLGEELGQVAPRAARAWERLSSTPTRGTPPQVARGVQEAAAALAPVVSGLRDGASGADVAASLLGVQGPRSLLVALQNNAELRGGGGYASTFATGTVAEGRLQLGPFRDVAEVFEPVESARPVRAGAEFREDFAPFLADTTLWRMWTMSPHVPDDAAVGAAVAEQLLGERPTALLLLDVPAVAALVELTGQPVSLPGEEPIPADRLVESLLVESYAEAGGSEQAQQDRRAALRAAAGTVAASLLDSDVELGNAVRTLGQLARGRHLVLWSADAGEQEQLEQIGLAGALEAGPDDLLHVSVNNLSANKLDYYVDREVVHEVELGGSRADIVSRVRLTSTAPPGLVPYVAGTTTPDVSSLRIEFSFPRTATFRSLTVNGVTAKGDVRFGQHRARAFTYAQLARGQTVEVELRHQLPIAGGVYSLRAVPQALARDAGLRVVFRGRDGARLDVPTGFRRTADGVERVGPWPVVERLEVAVQRPRGWAGLREDLLRFWREPVQLG